MLRNSIEIKWKDFRTLIKNGKKLEPLLIPLENYVSDTDIIIIRDINHLMVDCFVSDLFEKGEVHVRR